MLRKSCVPMCAFLLASLTATCKTRTNNTGKASGVKSIEGLSEKVLPNHVSFLLPRAGKLKSAEKRERIAISEAMMPMKNFEVVHKANFNELSAQGFAKGAKAADIYNNLFVSGVRFDPCATQAFVGTKLDKATKCEPEFRLTVQYWNPNPGDANALADAALHFVYRVKEDEVASSISALLKIFKTEDADCKKIMATTPIGTHPFFVGLDSNESNDTGCQLEDAEKRKVFEELTDFVVQKADAANLKGVAIMVTRRTDVVDGLDTKTLIEPGNVPQNGETRWEWKIAINLPPDKGGFVVIPQMPKVGAKSSSVGFNARGANGRIVPASTGNDNLLPDLLGPLVSKATIGDPKLKAAIKNAVELEDPRLTKLPVFGTDLPGPACTGCHVQTLAKIRANNAGLATPEEFTLPPGLPDGVTNAMNNSSLSEFQNNGAYIVLNFGYHPVRKTQNAMPAINQRTINETIDVVHFINSDN